MPTGNKTDGEKAATNATLTVAPITRAIAATTARSTLIPAGFHRIMADTDCYVLQGGVAVDATTSSTLLLAGQREVIAVADALDGYVAVIRKSADGTLYISQL